MIFYCIIEEENEENLERVKLLKKACDEKRIGFNLLEANKFDFINPPCLEEGDLIYRATPGERATSIERVLLNKKCTAFYKDYKLGLNDRTSSFFMHQKEGLPVVKTIPDLPSDRSILKKYAKFLGGFPLIVKVRGNRHGVGVIRVDSFESLVSIADYLTPMLENKYFMREYIDHTGQGRLIVLGNKVIASHENKVVEDDFRTNVGNRRSREAKKFSKEMEDVAIKAVTSLGLEFGGVDLLLCKTGKYFISEVNFPCHFPTTQTLTKVDIAGKMVEYLVNKSKS